MSLPQHIPERLRPAVLHAIAAHDKLLLNRIELELVRELNIQPNDGGEKWLAVGIAEIDRDLVVRWKNQATCKCTECDGDGVLEAVGNKRTYEMECPACDGSGESDEAEDLNNVCWTDIDGMVITMKAPNEDCFFTPIDSLHDPLAEFLREQAKQDEVPARSSIHEKVRAA